MAEDTPTLKDLYDALLTERCWVALVERFLPGWLPQDMTHSEKLETYNQLPEITQPYWQWMQCHFLSQDPTLDTHGDIDDDVVATQMRLRDQLSDDIRADLTERFLPEVLMPIARHSIEERKRRMGPPLLLDQGDPSILHIYSALPTEECDRALDEHLSHWLPGELMPITPRFVLDDPDWQQPSFDYEEIKQACLMLLQSHLVSQDKDSMQIHAVHDEVEMLNTLGRLTLIEQLPILPSKAPPQEEVEKEAAKGRSEPPSQGNISFAKSTMYARQFVDDLLGRFLPEVLVPLVAAHPRLVEPTEELASIFASDLASDPTSAAAEAEAKLLLFGPPKDKDEPPTR